MKKKPKNNLNGKPLIFSGLVAIVILFVVYNRYQNSELVTPDAVDFYIRLANTFYIILITAFGAIAFGLYRYHKQKFQSSNTGLLSIIAIVTWNSRSRKIFVATFIAYGIFFSLTSGTLVYQPEVSFSYHYGAEIPSAQISPCCSAPGYMPLILVYLTDHIGLQIIPINLVLQVIVSYLVGLNTSIAVSAISLSKKNRGLGTVGATTGLFIACPTCAGSLFSIFVGTTSGIALTVALSQLQTIFIGISIPILLVTPFILARKLRNADGSCAIKPNDKN